MCVLGDVAEMVARYAPLEIEQEAGSELRLLFANQEHAGEFVYALKVLIRLHNGELE